MLLNLRTWTWSDLGRMGADLYLASDRRELIAVVARECGGENSQSTPHSFRANICPFALRRTGKGWVGFRVCSLTG